MAKSKYSSFAAAFAVYAVLGLQPIAKADIPGITFDEHDRSSLSALTLMLCSGSN